MNLPPRKVPVSNLLPTEVRDALVEASRIEKETMRVAKIDTIYSQARRKYPQFFKSE